MALRPGTTYYYRVKAVNATSDSPYSESMAVTTLANNTVDTSLVRPAEVPSVSIRSVEPTSLNFTIAKPPTDQYINNYIVQVATASDFSVIAYTTRLTTDSGLADNKDTYSARIDGLLPNTSYFVRFRAINAIGFSLFSTTLNIATPHDVGVPVVAGVTLLTAISARLNWVTVPGASSYRVDVSASTNFSSLVVSNQSVTAPTTFLQIPTLIEATRYFARVRAVNSAGNIGANSETISFTTLNNVQTENELSFTPTAPTVLRIDYKDTTSFDLVWAVNSATPVLYEAALSTTSNFASLTSAIVAAGGRASFTGLSPESIYYYRLKAFDIASSAFVTGQITTLKVNTGLNAPQLSVASTQLSKTVKGVIILRGYATLYKVQLSTASNFTNPVTQYTEATSFSFENLTSNTTYYLRVYGLNSIDSSNPSVTYTVTTAVALPAITTSPTTEVTQTSATLNWTANAAYVKYILDVRQESSSTSGLYGNLYRNFDVGYVNKYRVDLLLSPGTTYRYKLTGVTSTGDTLSTAWVAFSTLVPAGEIKLTSGELRWAAGRINRLEMSTSRLFTHCLPGARPKILLGTACPISQNIDKYGHLYLRAYLDNGTAQSELSEVISTATSPFVFPITRTITSLNVRVNAPSLPIKLAASRVSGNTLIPLTPVILQNTDTYTFEGLIPGTGYVISADYYDIATQRYVNIEDVTTSTKVADVSYTLDTGLAVPVITASNIADEYFTINIDSPTYTKVTISRRSDINFVEESDEGAAASFLFQAEPSSVYTVTATRVDVATAKFSNSSTITVTTPASNSEAVGALTVASSITGTTIVNTQQVLVTWGAVVGATDYRLECSAVSSFDTLATDIVQTRVSATSILLSALNSTVRYYLRVYPYNRRVIGPVSAVVNVKTVP